MKMQSRQPGKVRRSPQHRRRIRRRRFGLLVFVMLFVALVSGSVWGLISYPNDNPDAPDTAETPETPVAGESAEPEAPSDTPSAVSGDGEKVETSAGTPAAAAHASLASVPEGQMGDVIFTQMSSAEPSRAAVWFSAPAREGRSRYFVFFVREDSEGVWESYRSVVAGDQEFPRDIEAMMADVPEDLENPVLRTGQNTADASPNDVSPDASSEDSSEEESPQRAALRAMQNVSGTDGWRAASPRREGDFFEVAVERGGSDGERTRTNVYLREKSGALSVSGIGRDLTGAELPGFPSSLVQSGSASEVQDSIEPAGVVYDGDGVRAELTESGVSDALATVEDYPGVVGFYAMNPENGAGFGVRPDEQFFSASTIKVGIMAAVYRKIDEGELAYSDALTTNDDDWAAGAGWLRWNTPGAQTTVEDALWLMMTESDNVATNVLTRTVGGPDYVNGVMNDLGADETELFWKLSSERAAVPALDNHTTPKDMATMLSGIYAGDGYTGESRDEMLDLMSQNNLEYWLEGGVPQGVETANKGGWLDGTYNDVGLVEGEGSPYVLAIYTMYGPEMEVGSPVLSEVSGDVWLAETGETKKESEARIKRESSAGNDPAKSTGNDEARRQPE